MTHTDKLISQCGIWCYIPTINALPARPGIRRFALSLASEPLAIQPVAGDDVAGEDAVRAIERSRMLLDGRCVTLPDLFSRQADVRGEHVAFRFIQDAREPERYLQLTYGELKRRVLQSANLFSDLGASADRPVGHLLPPGIDTHPVIWGAASGAACCAINPFLEPAAIAGLAAAAGCRVLVAPGPDIDEDIWLKALEVRSRLGPALVLVRVGGVDAGAGEISYADAVGTMRSERLDAGAPSPDAVSSIFHTGGTTGLPKLVRQTHRRQTLAAAAAVAGFQLQPQDRVLCGMPLFHVGGLYMGGLAPFTAGARVVHLTAAGFRNPAVIENYWRIVRAHRATITSGAPTVYAMLARQACAPGDADSLRYAVSSAAGMPAEIQAEWERRTSVPINQVYGLTEAMFMVSANPPGRFKAGTVGIRLPHVGVRTARRSARGDWVDCGPGEVGELLVKGETVFDGYEGVDPSKTFADGWLRTGDLATIDGEGYIRIVGREKDLIIRGGHNIDPVVIEEAFHAHPDVALCAAVGRPDAHVGEMPVVFVQARAGTECEVEALMEHARRHIPERAAHPKAIHLVDRLPTTAVGKIFKPPLRTQAARLWFSEVLRAALERHPFPEVDVVVGEDGPNGRDVTVLVDRRAQGGELAGVIGKCLSPYHVNWKIEAVAR